MNNGAQTPKRAAQPLSVVRLVSFGAAVLLAALALLGVALLRYPLEWREVATPAVIVSEVAAPARDQRPRPPPLERRPQPESAEPSAPSAPPADAQQSAGPAPVITQPVWIQRPRNPARFYPRAAFIQGVEGEVVLDCDVEVNGRLQCEVTSETPAGHGFGDAALAIAAAHVMQPAMRDGAPVRARYRMIVPFATGE